MHLVVNLLGLMTKELKIKIDFFSTVVFSLQSKISHIPYPIKSICHLPCGIILDSCLIEQRAISYSSFDFYNRDTAHVFFFKEKNYLKKKIHICLICIILVSSEINSNTNYSRSFIQYFLMNLKFE